MTCEHLHRLLFTGLKKGPGTISRICTRKQLPCIILSCVFSDAPEIEHLDVAVDAIFFVLSGVLETPQLRNAKDIVSQHAKL